MVKMQMTPLLRSVVSLLTSETLKFAGTETTSTVPRCEDNMKTTLRETDIAPENSWLEEEISLCEGLFSGAMLILRSVG